MKSSASMLSAVLRKPGSIELQRIEVPEPAEGELLVRVEAALTCGTDLKAYLRGHNLIPMPGPFGHEFSGVVAKRGKGVRKFREGDAVMAVHSAPCRSCSYCRKGLPHLCQDIMRTKVLGAFAEYIVLPRNIVSQNVFSKPGSLGFSEAAFLEPLSCVVHGMKKTGIRIGDTVLIIGAGPIGLLHLLLAKERGATVLIADREKGRLSPATALGADSTIPSPGIERTIRKITGAAGVDCVFECTGQPAVWESAVTYVRRGGTIVLFGGCKAGTQVCYSADRLHYDELCLMGTFHFTPHDVRTARGLLTGNRIDVKRLISGTFRLTDINKAFSLLSQGKGIKYAITP